MRAYAKVIADSINEDGIRLTTFEARFWRPVLAEFNTHCVLSRNSASSRAIPLRKMLDRVADPATPLLWAAEQKGMQGGDEVSEDAIEKAVDIWERAGMEARGLAKKLGDLGIHKSIANRLLEPFMWHTAVVTATAWDNFFEQRCSPLAQPEIREVAELMREAREASEPDPLEDGEWHLPYIDDQTKCEALQRWYGGSPIEPSGFQERLAPISAARCARVSYLTQDGVRDLDKDLELYDRLVTARPAHWSPLEHVATPWLQNFQEHDYAFHFIGLDGDLHVPPTEHLPRIGKLLQWRTLRTTIETQLGAVTYR